MKNLGRFLVYVLIWTIVVGGYNALTGYTAQGWKGVGHDCVVVLVCTIWDCIYIATKD